MTRILRAAVTDELISLTEHEDLVASVEAGAVVSFAGVVRNHDGGRQVLRLEYSAHPSASETLFEVLAEVAGSATGVRALAASHRVGPLELGRRRAGGGRCSRSPQGCIRDLRTAGGHDQGPHPGVEAPVLRRRNRRVGELRLVRRPRA